MRPPKSSKLQLQQQIKRNMPCKKIVWKSWWWFSKPVPMQSRLASVSSENGLQTTGPRDHQRIHQNSTKVSLSLTFSFPSFGAVYKQLFLKGEVPQKWLNLNPFDFVAASNLWSFEETMLQNVKHKSFDSMKIYFTSILTL